MVATKSPKSRPSCPDLDEMETDPMSNAVSRFLGDSPLRVAIKLAVFSLIVGVIMSAVGWSPRTIYEGIVRFFQRLWDLGFEAIYSSFEYFFLGAAIVIPAFILIRLLSFRTPRN